MQQDPIEYKTHGILLFIIAMKLHLHNGKHHQLIVQLAFCPAQYIRNDKTYSVEWSQVC